MIDIRLPSITATDERGQIAQLRSYIYQFAEQLKYALDAVDTKVNDVTEAVAVSSSVAAKQAEKENNFSELKSLIIKSSDIVDAYADMLTQRLDGHYVAQSDFGTYFEQTTQEITGTPTAIEQMFTDIQSIESNVQGGTTRDSVEIVVNGRIKSGLLYYDAGGVPVYGVEVGQTDTVGGEESFRKYARFIGSRLSFYDNNDVEVAYISDYNLHITNAEIAGNLKLGGYLIDTSNGLAFKWQGVS